MSGTLRLRGATSGYSELQAPAVAADQTFILPTAGGTLLTTDSPVPKLTLELGSASQPSLTFEGDTDTGLYSSGTNTLNLVTGGNNRLNIDSSGNVGIGTTSPSVPFTVQSDSGTNAIAVLGRSADDISTTLFYENDGTTQIGRIQARQSYLHIAGTDNTKGIFLDNSGNVGIGEATPAAGLDVKVDTNPVLAIDRGSANTANFNLQYNGTVTGQLSAANGDFQISAAGASTPISFYANGSERMRINNLGNILIGGTTSANSDIVLNADGTAIFDGDVTVHGDAQLNQEGVKIQSGLITAVQTNGSNSVFRGLTTAGGDYNIDLKADGTATFAGNVGIGTSSPQDLLHLSSVSSPTIRIENTDTSVSVGQILGAIEFEGNDASTNANGIRAKIEAEYRGIGAQTNLRVYVAKENVATPYEALDIGTGGIVLSTENSERMRIDSSGNLLIGTTSTFDATDSSNPSGNFFGFINGKLNLQSNIESLAIKRHSSNGSVIQFSRGGTGPVGSISITSGGTSFNTSSDYRLKKNLVDLTGAISRLKTLPVYRFNFIADSKTTVDGFLAHEAQAVVPEAVTGEKDGKEMQGIDQSKLVPLLTAALQEAIGEIETLKQRLSDAGIA